MQLPPEYLATIRVGERAGLTRGDGVPVAAMVRAVSPFGIGLLTTEKWAKGERFTARIPAHAADSLSVTCVVAKCEPGGVAIAGYVVAATFEAVVSAGVAAQPLEVARIRNAMFAA